MARKKVTLAWIANDATRRMTMRKRRKGLIKKVSELSTLCGVEACAIIYAPGEGTPEVWPSESTAKLTLEKYKAMPATEQCKKRLDQVGFLGQGVGKLQDQIRKKRGENWEIGLKTLFDGILEGKRSLMDLKRIEETLVMDRIVSEKIRELEQKVIEMKAKATTLILNPNPNPNGGMELGFWNGGAMMRTDASSSSLSNRVFTNSNPNPSSEMEFGLWNGVEAMKPMATASNLASNPGEGMELGFWNGVTVKKMATCSSNPGFDVIPNADRNPHDGMDLRFCNGVATVKTEATTPYHDYNPNPCPGGSMDIGYWSGDRNYQGFEELEALFQGTSSSSMDLPIFKDCPF